MNDLLQIVRHPGFLELSLNRPEKRNALNLPLCHALVDALETADPDPSVRAILLTGQGKSFCAGMDLTEVLSADTEQISDVHERLFTIGSRLRTPLVGAVRGSALGGGTGLVANCHIVIAGADATFGFTEIRLGLWPFLIYRAVAQALGERRTLELALRGRTFGGRHAVEIGLAHELATDPEGHAREIASALGAASPTAIRKGLEFVQETKGASWHSAGLAARRIRQEVFESPDFREGVRAFQKKRPPKWPSLE